MTLVIAHRGASKAAHENTLRAFFLAKEFRADWIELDVRRTQDGRLAVHHDAHLADGRVLCDTPADELPRHVPELAAALDACSPLGINIEIKNWPTDPDFDPEFRLAAQVVEPNAMCLATTTALPGSPATRSSKNCRVSFEGSSVRLLTRVLLRPSCPFRS